MSAPASLSAPQSHDTAAGGGAVAPSHAPATSNGRGHALLTPLIARVFADDHEYRRYAHGPAAADPRSLQDFLFAADGDEVTPESVFRRLRWGGQFVCASR